jgi:hypothetical protein
MFIYIFEILIAQLKIISVNKCISVKADAYIWPEYDAGLFEIRVAEQV